MDFNTMNNLLSNSSLLNYNSRSSYVNSLISNSTGEVPQSQTFRAIRAREKEGTQRTLVKNADPSAEFFDESKTAVESLKSAIENISSASGLQVTSGSDAIKGSAQKGAVETDYTINTTQLAAKQTNTGSTIGTFGKDFEEGEHTLDIKVGNVTTSVSFTVTAADTNKSSMEKMAKAINKADLGITASVATEGTVKSTLNIAAKTTGTDNKFTITSKTGNAVAATGADKVNTVAKDAEYKLNGISMYSQSNTINLQNGKVQVSLLKADGKDTSVKVEPAPDDIAKKVSSLVDAYNGMLSATNSHKGSSSASYIGEHLNNLVQENFYSLKEIGIKVDSSGQMTVDQDKLKAAITKDPSKIDALFGSEGKLTKKAETELAAIEKLSKAVSSSSYSYQMVKGDKNSSLYSVLG